MLTPHELLDRLAVLIPLPRRHRHHYHGVFAPHATLRAQVTAQARQPLALAAMNAVSERAGTCATLATAPRTVPPSAASPEAPPRRRASALWAWLIARIYECLPLTCPHCGAEMRLIACITEAARIEAILLHLGEPTTPLPLAPRARAPPALESADASFACDQTPCWNPAAAVAVPAFEFDQTCGR